MYLFFDVYLFFGCFGMEEVDISSVYFFLVIWLYLSVRKVMKCSYWLGNYFLVIILYYIREELFIFIVFIFREIFFLFLLVMLVWIVVFVIRFVGGVFFSDVYLFYFFFF